MKNKLQLLLIIGCVLWTSAIFAQNLSGRITNENGSPIPYANVFITEIQTGTASDDEGNYFVTIPAKGEYTVIVSSMGYETKSLDVVIGDRGLKLNVSLQSSSIEIDELVVKASKKDSAYAIIRSTIKNKKKYLRSVSSFKSEVYVKATETIKNNRKKKKKKKVEEVDVLDDNSNPVDPIQRQNKEDMSLLSSLNMVEMQLTLNYQYPKKYKEERTAYKRSGTKAGLFIPYFDKTDFNFYRNMVRLEGIAEAPVISPISSTSILSYKYKLVETNNEGGQIVYKIKVIPRKSGNSTCKGYIYINKGLWNINRVDFKFNKGGLKFYDAFQLKIDYTQIDDTLWIPSRQEFIYETKIGRYKRFKGNTVMLYSDYQHNFPFPRKFFGNEVVKITQEAYDRDSSYWNESRPEPLTVDEKKMVFLRDSIDAVVNSDEYQDSIMKAYNKITLLEIFWEGVGWRNNKKKSDFYTGPLPSMINYSIIGGWRTGPFLFYFKRWESGRRMRLSGRATYGFLNKDVQGNFNSWFRYNAHKMADIRFGFGRSVQTINQYDAFLNQLRTSNYIMNESVYASHRFELVNGLYLTVGSSYNNRQPLEGFIESDLSRWIERETEIPDIPLDFEGYQALIADVSLSYTPAQRYMTRPNNKVILGSKYPTFTLFYRKGVKNIFSSDIDFDYLEFNVKHDLTLGALGNSKYTAKIGQFFNTQELKFIDLKRFRQSDPYWYSQPLYSFQSLDTSVATSQMFFEVHHIHHFNGALINNIPLIKKTNIRLVAGAGFLWAKEGNLRHEEIFAGVERVFKLGARRRMRLGFYGVLANGNYREPGPAYKISIDIIDTWKKNWSY